MKLRLIIVLLAGLMCSTSLFAQVTVSVRVNSGTSSSTCDDGPFGAAIEPQWEVNVHGSGYVTYPMEGLCYTNPPYTQYSEPYNCTVPTTINICLRVFEDDGVSCLASRSCLVTRCLNYPIPSAGTSATYTLAIPNTSPSWGQVNFTITVTGSAPPGGAYNTICNAVNLGTLTSGNTIGNSALSNYGNFCANNAGEPNPWGGDNDQGVWFQFTTGNDPGAVISFDANSDPSNLGDDIDLQLALYRSSNSACSGTLSLVRDEYDGMGLFNDEDMDVNCLMPNTTYFLLVDGEYTAVLNPNGHQGYFGLSITDDGSKQAADLICDAEDLGAVPIGGSVATGSLDQSNFCATSTGDPTPSNWNSDKTVWYEFQAPSSGSVTINATSDLPWPAGTDAIDLQLAVYSSNTGLCSGTLTEIDSDYEVGLFN